jgi:hypothetical protein
MDDVGGVAEHDPARPAPGGRAADDQRPGGASRAERSSPASPAVAAASSRVERFGVHRQQGIGTIARQRPDKGVRALRLRPVEGQQREHVGRAEPLARDVAVRPRRDQPRRDRALAVVAALEAGVEPGDARRGAAFAMGDEGRGDVGVDPRDVRREAQRGVELALERAGVGDDGELADALLPRRELEPPGVESPCTTMSWTGVVAPGRGRPRP